MMMTINQMPQPVIAKVQGLVTTAGCQLVAACDLAVAVDTAVVANKVPKHLIFGELPKTSIGNTQKIYLAAKGNSH